MAGIVQAVYHSAQVLQKHPHFHDCHQIILVVRGEVTFCVNEQRIRATAGELAVFSRYENHSVCGCSDGYERYVLQIDPDVANRKSPVYSLLTDRPSGFCNVIDVSAHLGDMLAMFKRILREHHSEEKLAKEMEQLTVKQLLITICRNTSVDFDQSHDHIVADLKRQFETNCQERYTLRMLANQYNISISTLSHRFRAATGVSVMGYLQSCRIAQAKQMLANTDVSIGQIVERCGFSDNSNFGRTFFKLNGISPSAFRKKYKSAIPRTNLQDRLRKV